jgi:putative PEP-CTERM system histidine kinase
VPSIGVISYGLASAAFLFLTIVLALGWQGRPQGARLIVACGVMVAWGAVMALDSQGGMHPTGAVPLLELLRYAAWFVLLDGLAQAAGVGRRTLAALRGAIVGAALVFIVLFARQDLAPSAELQFRWLGYGGIALAALGLAFVVLLLRRTGERDRSALELLLIALGAMFGYDLLMYSLAQLVPGVAAASWDARGLLAVLTAPMIAIAARRHSQWSPELFVSRDVVFHLTVAAIATAYAAIVLLGSSLIVARGGSWGGVLRLVFVALAVLAALALVGSAELRRRLRVFLNKHFYRSKYDYRAEWLRFIQTLSAADPDLDPRGNAIRAVAQIIASPGGMLYLRVDGDAGFTPVCTWPRERFDGRLLASVPVSHSLVTFFEQRQWVVDVQEWRSNPALYGEMTLPDTLGPATPCRILLPLLHGAGLIGFVALDDPPTEFHPNYEDRDLLKTVGRHVATYIAQHEADRRLAESRQFEAYHRLTAFVMHDLKNLAAQLALIVANAERHRRNPEFVDDTIRTVANSTRRMQRLIEQLQGRDVQEQGRSVVVADVVRRAVERCGLRRPVPAVEADEAGLAVLADPERLVAAFEHVIRNAQDATPESGSVRVTVSADGEDCVVAVTDTGCGMTEEFLGERLFKPFDTTKGNQGMGIGAYQLREYVRSLGGAVEVASVPGRGTTFVVRLKLRPS